MPSKLPRLSQPNLYNLDQRLSQPNLFSLDPCEKETKIEESNKIFKNKEMRSLQNPSLELIKNENEEEDSFFYFENNKEDIEEINQIITSQIDLLKEKKEHLTEIKQLNTLIKEEINNKGIKFL